MSAATSRCGHSNFIVLRPPCTRDRHGFVQFAPLSLFDRLPFESFECQFCWTALHFGCQLIFCRKITCIESKRVCFHAVVCFVVGGRCRPSWLQQVFPLCDRLSSKQTSHGILLRTCVAKHRGFEPLFEYCVLMHAMLCSVFRTTLR